MRLERERASVQREIDQLQEAGGAANTQRIMVLWEQKKALLERIEALRG
jgi:hypothetical protein